MWERILWATDFCACSHGAGRRALAIAHWADAAIDVVTVIPPDAGDLPPMLVSFVGEEGLRDAERGLETAVETEALQRLTDETAFLVSAGRTPALHVRLGDPPEQIVAVAEELGSDLIVMGATCHRGVKDVIFGGTLDVVTRRAPCPVLVVR